MRFMMIVKADPQYEAGMPPPPELMAAIGKLSQEMMEAGIVVENGGLLPSAFGAKVRAKNGKLSVTDGPFPETKELIGGFAIVDASSKDEAIQLAKKFMKVHTDTMGASYEGECEVRQMAGPGECGGANGKGTQHR